MGGGSNSPDFIFSGALSIGSNQNSKKPTDLIKNSLLGNINLLELSNQNTKFINMSSQKVYDSLQLKQLKQNWKICLENATESNSSNGDCTDLGIYDGTPTKNSKVSEYFYNPTWLTSYKESKKMNEIVCLAYAKEKGVQIINARIGSVYGQGQKLNSGSPISDFTNNSLNNENIKIKGDGKTKRMYCHVFDITSALIYLAVFGKCGEAYNITNDSELLSTFDIASIIQNFSEKPLKVEILQDVNELKYSKTIPQDLSLSTKKIRSLGWCPKISFRDGIKQTLDFYKK